MLNSGEVPNLFEKDELEQVLAAMRPRAKEAGIAEDNRDEVHDGPSKIHPSTLYIPTDWDRLYVLFPCTNHPSIFLSLCHWHTFESIQASSVHFVLPLLISQSHSSICLSAYLFHSPSHQSIYPFFTALSLTMCFSHQALQIFRSFIYTHPSKSSITTFIHPSTLSPFFLLFLYPSVPLIWSFVSLYLFCPSVLHSVLHPPIHPSIYQSIPLSTLYCPIPIFQLPCIHLSICISLPSIPVNNPSIHPSSPRSARSIIFLLACSIL